MSKSPALMKMAAHGIEKAERTLEKKDTDVDGQRWVGQSHDGSSEWKETVQMIECFDLQFSVDVNVIFLKQATYSYSRLYETTTV